MAPTPLILLPPSEGKAPGGTGPPFSAEAMAVDLGERRRQVAGALVDALDGPVEAQGRLLGVKGETLERAVREDRELTTAPTLPALERYTGVLYDAMGVSTLTRAQRTRAHRSVLIVSG